MTRTSDRSKKDSQRKHANKENAAQDQQAKALKKAQKAKRREERERRQQEELTVERREDSDEVRKLKGKHSPHLIV